jgi:hypothetical protein
VAWGTTEVAELKEKLVGSSRNWRSDPYELIHRDIDVIEDNDGSQVGEEDPELGAEVVKE